MWFHLPSLEVDPLIDIMDVTEIQTENEEQGVGREGKRTMNVT
jgi:hypothetical protein